MVNASRCSLATLCALLAASTGALRTTSAAESAPASIVVMIVPADQNEASVPVIQAVKAQFADLEVQLLLRSVDTLARGVREQIGQAEQAARAHDALAVFWCDLSSEEHMFLYLSEKEGNRVFVRRLSETEKGGRAEALAIIVRDSIAEMLRGAKIGVEVVKMVEPPPVPEVTAAPEDTEPEEEPRGVGRWLYGQIGYTYYGYSGDQPVVHGLGLGLGVHIHSNISIIGGYTILATIEEQRTIEEQSKTVSLRVSRHPVNLGLRAHYFTGIIDIGGALVFVMDYAAFESHSFSSSPDVNKDNGDLLLSVVPAVEVVFVVAGKLGLFISAGAEISLIAKHYLVEITPGEKMVLLDSWPVQPWAVAGLRIGII
ncbi:MAG: hypothetical protein GY854_08095 [Deltaproteobacteria bacterium]|nr:hypothetical protein [Deltaproteobacteria bacterium]